jgi:hypothetical protein
MMWIGSTLSDELCDFLDELLHSFLSASTGLFIPAFTVCKLMVMNAMINARPPAERKDGPVHTDTIRELQPGFARLSEKFPWE